MQTQQSLAGIPTGRRVAAYAAITLGVLGIIFSLAGVFGVWYARSVVAGVSTDLTGSVDGGLQRADDQVSATFDRVAQTRERLQELESDARQLGSGPTGRAAAEQLGAAVDRELGPPVGALREAYGAASVRVTAGIELLTVLDRLPGIDVPELPTQELEALDTRLREIDADLRGVREALDEQGLPLGTLGSRIAERVGSLETRVAELQTAVDGVRSKLDSARESVARVNATVLRITAWLALGLTLLLLWNVVLHLLLLLRGRAWLRGEPYF